MLLNAKIAGLALVFALGATSLAVAGTTDSGYAGTAYQISSTHVARTPVHQGRSVYVAPTNSPDPYAVEQYGSNGNR